MPDNVVRASYAAGVRGHDSILSFYGSPDAQLKAHCEHMLTVIQPDSRKFWGFDYDHDTYMRGCVTPLPQ